VVPISVNGADIVGVSVISMPGWSMSGRVTVEAGVRPESLLDRFRFSAILVDGDTTPNPPVPPPPPAPGVLESGRLKDDWTFTVTNVFGAARVRATVPDGWSVKAILHEGRDVTDEPFDPKPGEDVGGLTVVRPAASRS